MALVGGGNLPAELASKIQPGLAIEWWGRRAFYEVIEELSDSVWWSIVIVSLLYNLYQVTGELRLWFGLIFLIYPFQGFFFEFLKWKAEVYVVCRNDNQGGGRVYKFSGVLNRKTIDDAVSASGPAATTEEPWNIRLWGRLTGERMQKVHLSSQNNQYVDGRRLPPQFLKAISSVRGAEPVAKEQNLPGTIQAMRELDRARSSGLIPQHEAVAHARALAHRLVWGE